MTNAEEIKTNSNYICYNKYLKIAYGGEYCGNVGCYDLRDYYDFVNKEENFNIVYSSVTQPVVNNLLWLNGSHAFANIKIFNATYAKLVCKQSQTGIIEIPLDNVESYFTFLDITLENPLFSSNSGFLLQIETDGLYSIYDAIFFPQKIVENIFINIGNNYTLSWFYSKNVVLFAGNIFQQSFIAPIDDVIVIPKPDVFSISKQLQNNNDVPKHKKQRKH